MVMVLLYYFGLYGDQLSPFAITLQDFFAMAITPPLENRGEAVPASGSPFTLLELAICGKRVAPEYLPH